jgi:hypothetical protein
MAEERFAKQATRGNRVKAAKRSYSAENEDRSQQADSSKRASNKKQTVSEKLQQQH